VPHIIQQPGGPAVVQLQAQPHHVQQAGGGQTVIAVQPAQSQENHQQNAEVNYSPIYQLATAQGGGQGPIFITTQTDQTQENQQDAQQTE